MQGSNTQRSSATMLPSNNRADISGKSGSSSKDLKLYNTRVSVRTLLMPVTILVTRLVAKQWSEVVSPRRVNIFRSVQPSIVCIPLPYLHLLRASGLLLKLLVFLRVPDVEARPRGRRTQSFAEMASLEK